MPIRGDMRYHITRRLKLARRRLLRWNRLEVGNIFRRIEEADISVLQMREDRKGGLQESNLREIHHKLLSHHFISK